MEHMMQRVHVTWSAKITQYRKISLHLKCRPSESVHPGECKRGNRVLIRVLCGMLCFAYVAAFCGQFLRYDTTVNELIK